MMLNVAKSEIPYIHFRNYEFKSTTRKKNVYKKLWTDKKNQHSFRLIIKKKSSFYCFGLMICKLVWQATRRAFSDIFCYESTLWRYWIHVDSCGRMNCMRLCAKGREQAKRERKREITVYALDIITFFLLSFSLSLFFWFVKLTRKAANNANYNTKRL